MAQERAVQWWGGSSETLGSLFVLVVRCLVLSCARLLLTVMDRWMNRFIDASGDDVRERLSLVSDYIRALRLLGTSNQEAESLWRQMCITVDPLVAGQCAVARLRTYLTQVESLLGPVPTDFPVADYHPQDDDVLVGNARRAWADNILAANLDIGAPSRVTSHPGLLAGLGVHAHRPVVREENVGVEQEEPLVEPPPRGRYLDGSLFR